MLSGSYLFSLSLSVLALATWSLLAASNACCTVSSECFVSILAVSKAQEIA